MRFTTNFKNYAKTIRGNGPVTSSSLRCVQISGTGEVKDVDGNAYPYLAFYNLSTSTTNELSCYRPLIGKPAAFICIGLGSDTLTDDSYVIPNRPSDMPAKGVSMTGNHSGNKYILTYSYVANTNMTITKIGILISRDFSTISSSVSASTKYFMIAYENLSSPITLAAGETAAFTFSFDDIENPA